MHNKKQPSCPAVWAGDDVISRRDCLVIIHVRATHSNGGAKLEVLIP